MRSKIHTLMFLYSICLGWRSHQCRSYFALLRPPPNYLVRNRMFRPWYLLSKLSIEKLDHKNISKFFSVYFRQFHAFSLHFFVPFFNFFPWVSLYAKVIFFYRDAFSRRFMIFFLGKFICLGNSFFFVTLSRDDFQYFPGSKCVPEKRQNVKKCTSTIMHSVQRYFLQLGREKSIIHSRTVLA